MALAVTIHEGDVHRCFEDIDDLDYMASPQINFLLDFGYSIADAMECA